MHFQNLVNRNHWNQARNLGIKRRFHKDSESRRRKYAVSNHSVCGVNFSTDHAMICKHGGLTLILFVTMTCVTSQISCCLRFVVMLPLSHLFNPSVVLLGLPTGRMIPELTSMLMDSGDSAFFDNIRPMLTKHISPYIHSRNYCIYIYVWVVIAIVSRISLPLHTIATCRSSYVVCYKLLLVI